MHAKDSSVRAHLFYNSRLEVHVHQRQLALHGAVGCPHSLKRKLHFLELVVAIVNRFGYGRFPVASHLRGESVSKEYTQLKLTFLGVIICEMEV
jgi:hypothetical protein